MVAPARCSTPLLEPFKKGLGPNKYLLYKVYMGLVIFRGPPSQGGNHHFPYEALLCWTSGWILEGKMWVTLGSTRQALKFCHPLIVGFLTINHQPTFVGIFSILLSTSWIQLVFYHQLSNNQWVSCHQPTLGIFSKFAYPSRSTRRFPKFSTKFSR